LTATRTRFDCDCSTTRFDFRITTATRPLKSVTLEVEGARKTRKEGMDMDDLHTKLTDAVDRSKRLKTIRERERERERNWSD